MSEIEQLLDRLRRAGGDTTDIEVKSSAGGLSSTITSSLCAMANLPGGGWLILGLDEDAGFAPVALGDVATLKQRLAGKSRACLPPVQIDIRDEVVDGQPVVLARIAECPSEEKPCREAASGKAWIRAWDGDYTMSLLEEQSFLRQRMQSQNDRARVEGATFDDLDQDLLNQWLRTTAEMDPLGLGRLGHDDRLFRGGVVTRDGTPTKAGLLSLGVHPQQFFPRYVVSLAQVGAGNTRAREARTVSGPIPVMLDAVRDWAQKVFTSELRAEPNGAVRDVREYPLEAFRELISNALVHRDLSAWSEGSAVEVRLHPEKLVVSSPGGLYGITVDRLGMEGTTSARNPLLLEICRYARSADDSRVVESLASGIPRVFETLREGGHPVPRFHDSGVHFVALLRPAVKEVHPVGPSGGTGAAPGTPTEQAVMATLGPDPLTVAQLSERTGLKVPALRKALRTLIVQQLVERSGGQGQRGTTYRRPGGHGS